MATVDPCTLPLVPVQNDTCVTYPLGKQFVQLLYQEMAGAPPDLLTIATGADVRLATLQAALTATTGTPAGVDKLYVLKNIAGGLFKAPTEQKLQNNDVPYGGVVVTDRVYEYDGRIDHLTPSNSEAMNNITKRGRPLRVWFVDENDMVRGYVENAYLNFGGIISAGIGNATPTYRPVSVSYRRLTEAPFAAAPLAGIASITNA
jgi:hypothetical protein